MNFMLEYVKQDKSVCVFAQVGISSIRPTKPRGVLMGKISEDDFRTPGQLIAALLSERGWTQRVLAIVLEVDETSINRLVADKRPVDAAMALTLEELFSIPAERFLELQKSYDLAKARITARPDT